MKKEDLRIMLVSQLYPEVGGIQSWAHGYIEYCQKNDISLYCVDSSLIGKRGIDSNDRVNIIDEIKRSLGIWKQIEKGLKEYKPNIVHFNTACSSKGLIRDLISINKIKKYANKLVLHCHCNIEDQINDSKIGKNSFKEILKKVDKVIVLNKKSEQYVKRFEYKKIETIPNFIDENIIIKDKEISKEIKTVLFVGHIRETKGIKEILETSKIYKNISFKLVGPIIEKELVEELPNVIFTGPLSHEQVLNEMEKADIFLFPSYTEGFSVSVLEAMAKGLPIIATDVGANRETVNEGGLIIDKRINSLIEAIQQLSDYEIRNKMSNNSINNIKNYKKEKIISKIIEYYE